MQEKVKDSTELKSTVADRLASLMLTKGIKASVLARETGMTEGSLSKILSGKTKEIREGNLEKLSRYFSVSKDWLRFGEEGSASRLEDNPPAYLTRLVEAVENIAQSNRLLAESNQQLVESNAQLTKFLFQKKTENI